MRVWQKIELAYHEAKTKVTTYVALTMATIAELLAHAEELMKQWPDLMLLLPKTPILVAWGNHTLAGLACLALYTRIRRLLKTPAAS